MEVFSSLIWFEPLFKGSKLNKLNRELALEAYQFREMDHQGRRWSKKNYPGGYTSYGSITNVHQISSTFAELEKRIRQHVLDYARALHWEVNPDDLRVDSLWINIMPPQVIHTGHIHPHSAISGTYYVQIPTGSGPLKFEDPRLGFFMARPTIHPKAPQRFQPFISIIPKPGHVVLFESWMRHEVPQNLGKGDRISISFNYSWLR